VQINMARLTSLPKIVSGEDRLFAQNHAHWWPGER
jgi:hypothetical protein